MSRLFTSLGIRHPIIQAPMAGTATPELAAAVSEAGGLGSISIAAVDIATGRKMIRDLRERTAKAFNVNVFCHTPSVPDPLVERNWLDHLAPFFAEFKAPAPSSLHDIYTSFGADDAQLRLLLEERPAVVSFHLGLPPQSHIDALKAAGIVLFASATDVAQALAIQAAGVDAVVAQGIEAGGHRGVFDPLAADEQYSTLDLLEALRQRLSIAVIAAGGLMEGADIRNVLNRGAIAAQLGTAFVLCPESSANAAYRQMLASERASVTALTQVISGRPARGIVNRFITQVGVSDHPPVPGFGIAYNAGKLLSEAASKANNHEFSPFWAGTQAARAIALPAAELMALLIKQYAS